MSAFTSILVPLDGSVLSEQALDIAVQAVRAGGGEITLFVAVESQTAGTLLDYAQAENLEPAEAARLYLDQVAVRLAADGVATRIATSTGTNAAEEILAYAESAGSTMIVMTNHGRSGIGRWLLGSVADKVLRSATAPVLVVPVTAQESGPTS